MGIGVGGPLDFEDGQGGGGGGNLNVVMVPWTAITVDPMNSQRYTVALAQPFDLNGNAAADWSVVPGVPGTTSDQLVSATRTGQAWWATTCLQCGNEANVRRAFFSAFEQPPPGVPMGVQGCASGFQGNNDRAETTIFYGGLAPTVPLFFQLSWNGQTTLTLNGGQVMLISS